MHWYDTSFAGWHLAECLSPPGWKKHAPALIDLAIIDAVAWMVEVMGGHGWSRVGHGAPRADKNTRCTFGHGLVTGCWAVRFAFFGDSLKKCFGFRCHDLYARDSWIRPVQAQAQCRSLHQMQARPSRFEVLRGFQKPF